MAFDGDRGVAVMFGGGFDLITSDEMWEWDGEQWSLVAIGGTPLREHYGIAYDSVRHRGGECAAIFRPPALSNCRRERNLVFEWNGKEIGKVYELRELSD